MGSAPRRGCAKRSTSTWPTAGSAGLGWMATYPSARASPRTATAGSARAICSAGCSKRSSIAVWRPVWSVAPAPPWTEASSKPMPVASAGCPASACPRYGSNRESQAQPVREYLEALDAASAPARDEPKQATPKHLSETDPQAAWSTKAGAGCFRYETNYLVDTAHAVILDVEATPARLSQEIVAAKRMLQRTRDRLGLKPQRLAADGSYGTGPFLSWLMGRGIEPHVPVLERKHQTKGKLTRDAFAFDRKRNLFIC